MRGLAKHAPQAWRSGIRGYRRVGARSAPLLALFGSLLGGCDGGSVTVEVAAVRSVIVDAPNSTVQEQETMSLRAIPLDAEGRELTGRTVTWSSSDTSRATVNNEGVVTGVSAGPVTIRARVEGVEGQASLTVQSLHADAARVEVHTRGAAQALLAVWIDGEGWEDADGNSIQELPDPVDVEGEGLLPLRAGDRNASLTVRFFQADGSEVEMGTISRDDVTRARQCTEYEARYYPLDDNTNVLAWPNIRHPDGPTGPFQFARRANNDLVGIYHCDHIHLYGEAEGTVDIEFRLWLIDHSDMLTDPLRVRVEAGARAPEPARIGVQTRGASQAMLGVWTEGQG